VTLGNRKSAPTFGTDSGYGEIIVAVVTAPAQSVSPGKSALT
jgi:hypothetical protein